MEAENKKGENLKLFFSFKTKSYGWQEIFALFKQTFFAARRNPYNLEEWMMQLGKVEIALDEMTCRLIYNMKID